MNDAVFNGLPSSTTRIRKACSDDAMLWRAHLPAAIRDDVYVWVSFLHP
jgi:hypothetical protein